MTTFKRMLSLMLALCIMLSIAPFQTFASEPADTDEPMVEITDLTETDSGVWNQTRASTEDEFIRAFALDCGRLYFSVDQIKDIIDVMAKNDYTHLTLAFGNSGFRFLLDDMTIDSYASDDVKQAILDGNTYYTTHDGHTANDGTNKSNPTNACLTEADMDEIIAYADSKGIAIIPALNSPGHMNTIVYAMDQLGISDAGYPVSSYYNSESTININNSTVTGFVGKLIQKYIDYFSQKGCTYFNLGADEFANDPTDDVQLGFNDSMKSSFVSYVNSVATRISNAGMTPMMFNDGFAWADAQFNKDIVVCCWTTGNVNSATIANAGYRVINNNRDWYYVLGEPFGSAVNNWCSYAWAESGVNGTPVTQMFDGGQPGTQLIGSQMFLWCDYTDEVYTEEEAERVAALISTLAEKNPNYFTIPEEPDIRSITLEIDQTETDTIDGITYSDTDVVIADVSKVSVKLTTQTGATETTVSGNAAIELQAGKTYIIRVAGTPYALTSKQGGTTWGNSDGSPRAFEYFWEPNDTNMWTLEASGTGYKLKSDAGYLNLGLNAAWVDAAGENLTPKGSGSYWNLFDTDNYGIDALGGLYSYYCAGGWKNTGTQLEFFEVTKAGATSTVVEFTGLSAGTTTVTIGNTTYNVTVSEPDISSVTLTYHPWISTYSVHPEGTGSSNCNNPGIALDCHIPAITEGVNTEEGVAISELVAQTGDWRWEEGAQTVYWKATVLPDGSHQEEDSAIDHSMDGTDFTYIRYLNGTWSYSSDRENWTPKQSTDEICIYYLQATAVTVEVDTFVKDWAFTSDTAGGKDETRYQKAISIAVVYPDKTMNPAEENIYAESTLIYWDNLKDAGFLRIGINDHYQVNKITYTMGQRVVTDDTPRNWTADETINWETITDENNNIKFNETVCWDDSYGTEPVINGADLKDVIYAGDPTVNGSVPTYYNGTWGADDAVLFLIYIEPVITKDSLTVIYYDEAFNETLYSYTINVNSGTTFADITPAPEAFTGHADRINVNGCEITNDMGVVQHFQTNLTKVDAEGRYPSDHYSYSGSVIADENKTLYLYYNLNPAAISPNYVADFGMPLKFPLSDIVQTGQVDSVTVTENTRFGTLHYDEPTQTFTYTPSQILTDMDVLTISIQFKDQAAATETSVGVTPATTVYYDSTFMHLPEEGWTKVDGEKPALAAQVLGEATDAYGYDADMEDTGACAQTVVGNAIASYTFTGTGFDLYANCTETSGYAGVEVKNNAGAIVKLFFVDTVVKGTTGAATNNQKGDMDSLPIVTLRDLDYGTYTVSIRKLKDPGEQPVMISGIRVYETMPDSTIYEDDLEDDPDFYELRDNVLHLLGVKDLTSDKDHAKMIDQMYDQVSGTVALISDASVAYDKSATAQDILNNGPKNELFLWTDQTLTFKVKTDRTLQLGMKAPAGETSYEITGTTKDPLTGTVSTSTDQFYALENEIGTEQEYTISVTNTGNNLLSITLLKICDDPNAAFQELTKQDLIDTLLPNETDNDEGTDLIPEPDAPDMTEPDETIPETTAPEEEIPETTEPDTSTTKPSEPDETDPEPTVPDETQPDLSEPEETEPELSTPDDSDPDDNTPPEETQPSETRPLPPDPNEIFDPYQVPMAFTDIAPDSWYFEGVAYVYHHGLMNGTATDKFDPGAEMTRAMVATVLYRMEGSPEVEEEVAYKDVPAGKWYSDAITWATANGIAYGVGDNRFDPNANVTREQLATMLFRYFHMKGYSDAYVSMLEFPDAHEISSWAKPAMKWAVGTKLINGVKNGDNTILDPRGNALRSQIAVILQRFCENYGK